MTGVSRRDFLKFAGALALSSLIPSVLGDQAALAAPLARPDPPRERQDAPLGLGRVTNYAIQAYQDPKPGANVLGVVYRDTVLPILGVTSTEGLLPHNPIWFETSQGWLYSSWVQPVQEIWHEPVRSIPTEGLWGQVTVPYVERRSRPSDKSYVQYRLYYSSVFSIVACVEDDKGQSWYQLREYPGPGAQQYVRAEGLRIFSPDEFAPISPDVQDKLLEINIKEQMLYAKENGNVVFSTRCATGAAFQVDGQGIVNFGTPYGRYTVIRKSVSDHMIGGQGRSDYYDLPGVPFCTYFTGSGVAVHGAYWHNDFGERRSHGCVNVLADAAQWVYRWAAPVAGYNDMIVRATKGGTAIRVV